VELELTADPWNLKGDQASVVIGRDVITPGTFGPDGGRKPLGVFIPVADRPLTDAFGMEFFGSKIVRFTDIYSTNKYAQPETTQLQRLTAPYVWPSEMVGGLITVNEDERVRESSGARRITSISTTTEYNDTINWTVGFAMNQAGDKFHVLYDKAFDKRGIWLTNGRKFWLLQGGVLTQYLDLGVGLEGQRWDVARISRHLLMLVNDKYPARIIHLDEEPSTALSDNRTLAGLITPIKPRDVEIPGKLENNSWLMRAAGSGGSMDDGICRILVRAINVDDGARGLPATSRFVQVYDEANPTEDFLTVVDNDQVHVWTEPNNTSIAPPPLHERWTHIEIWRTTGAGVDYYREKVIEIALPESERIASSIASFTGATWRGPGAASHWRNAILKTGAFSGYTHESGDQVIITAPPDERGWRTGTYIIRSKESDDQINLAGSQGQYISIQNGVAGDIYRSADLFTTNALIAEQYVAGTLSDSELTGFPVMGIGDIVAGVPPPICRKVANLGEATGLGDVTICMGKAADSTVNPTADSRNFHAVDFENRSGSRQIFKTGHFTNYMFQAGDRFKVTGDTVNSGIGRGEYDIESRASDDAIQLTTSPGGTNTGGGVQGHIRRAYELDWPTIKSDEDVWYSRPDQFGPESFTGDVKPISSIGDTFRNMVNVGNYVAVLMDSGVHLLFRSGTDLRKDTIAAVGQGTPWERSVVVVTNTVLWASPEGPKAMTVSTEVASTGMRARIDTLGGTAIRRWFRDAFDADEEIDGGVDELNHCVRWRRHLADGTYQACQYSYRTGLWTLLDDDSGLAYASTAYAKSEPEPSPLLYSVESSGAVFQVNHQSIGHPYDGKTVQAVLDKTFSVSAGSIENRGIHRFSADMLGDVVRFRSANDVVNDVARVITSATPARIEFDAVAGLGDGDEFIIGANRFRFRPGPLQGNSPATVKTLEALTLRALPGPRNNGNGMWPDPPTGRFTLRSFREYHDTPMDEREREIEVFDEDDKSKTTSDRISALEGAGNALECELEMIDSRTDFRLELFEVRVREEGDEVADVSETE
jgi:hypothetical protein